jgi:hypothetical protein
MKKVFILILLLSLNGVVFAQQDSTTNRKYSAGKLIVKWSPLDVFTYFPSLNLALEYRLSQKFSTQLSGGPVLKNDGRHSNTDMNMKGYKVKFQVRRYFPSSSTRWWFFASPELSYNSVRYKDGRTYIVHQENLLDYYEYIESPRTYRETNVTFNGGAIYSKSRFHIDFQIGIAGRFIQYNKVPVKPDNYELTELNNAEVPFYKDESRNIISPSANIRLGFILIK